MYRAYLDRFTSSGYAEGWAYAETSPYEPLLISVVTESQGELGFGLAHRYRADLLDAGLTTAWCGFRIKLEDPLASVRSRRVLLFDRREGTAILVREGAPLVGEPDTALSALDDVVADDPTVLGSLDQLAGCDALFDDFVASEGVDGFVRAAYGYLLGRPADPSGLASYGEHLRSKKLTPYAILRAMADSEEYRERSRQHQAPTTPAFPFRIA